MCIRDSHFTVDKYYLIAEHPLVLNFQWLKETFDMHLKIYLYSVFYEETEIISVYVLLVKINKKFIQTGLGMLCFQVMARETFYHFLCTNGQMRLY